jgi:hypothetical protein
VEATVLRSVDGPGGSSRLPLCGPSLRFRDFFGVLLTCAVVVVPLTGLPCFAMLVGRRGPSKK